MIYVFVKLSVECKCEIVRDKNLRKKKRNRKSASACVYECEWTISLLAIYGILRGLINIRRKVYVNLSICI